MGRSPNKLSPRPKERLRAERVSRAEGTGVKLVLSYTWKEPSTAFDRKSPEKSPENSRDTVEMLLPAVEMLTPRPTVSEPAVSSESADR